MVSFLFLRIGIKVLRLKQIMSIFLSWIAIFIVIVPVAIWSLGTFVGLIKAKGVPYVPLTRKQLMLLNKYVTLKPDDIVVDLGCGDGRVLRLFERQGVKDAVGYEINLWAFLKAKLVNFLGRSKTKIIFKSFDKVNLGSYNVIFCYLLERRLAQLKNKFDQELKPGTIIISFCFPINNWLVPQIIYTNSKKNLNRIFIYKI